MTGRRTGRLRAAACALGTLGALLTGCADSDDPDATPSGSSSGGSSTSTATPSSPPPSSDVTPSASTSATVAPADGPPIRLPSLTARYPAGWRVVSTTEGTSGGGDTNPLTGGLIFVADYENIGSTDFDEIVANVLINYDNQKVKPERGENRVVDGVEGWVLQGTHKRELAYDFGTVTGGQYIHFTFTFLEAPRDAMEIIDSVLASVQWRGPAG